MKRLFTQAAIASSNAITRHSLFRFAQEEDNTKLAENSNFDISKNVNQCSPSYDTPTAHIHAHFRILKANYNFNLLTRDDNGKLFQPEAYDELSHLDERFSPDEAEIVNDKAGKVRRNEPQISYNGIRIDSVNQTVDVDAVRTAYATYASASHLNFQVHKTGALLACYSITPIENFNSRFAAMLDFADGDCSTDDFSPKAVDLALYQRRDRWGLWSIPSGFLKWIKYDEEGHKLLYDPSHLFHDVFEHTALREASEEALVKLSDTAQSQEDQIEAATRKLKEPSLSDNHLVATPCGLPRLGVMSVRDNHPDKKNQTQTLEAFYSLRFHPNDLPKLANPSAPDANEHKDFKIVRIAEVTPLLTFTGFSPEFTEFSQTHPGNFLFVPATMTVLQDVLLESEIKSSRFIQPVQTIFDNGIGNNSCCFYYHNDTEPLSRTQPTVSTPDGRPSTPSFAAS